MKYTSDLGRAEFDDQEKTKWDVVFVWLQSRTSLKTKTVWKACRWLPQVSAEDVILNVTWNTTLQVPVTPTKITYLTGLIRVMLFHRLIKQITYDHLLSMKEGKKFIYIHTIHVLEREMWKNQKVGVYAAEINLGTVRREIMISRLWHCVTWVVHGNFSSRHLFETKQTLHSAQHIQIYIGLYIQYVGLPEQLLNETNYRSHSDDNLVTLTWLGMKNFIMLHSHNENTTLAN